MQYGGRGGITMRKIICIILGCFITSGGILVLRHAHLVTGGVPGLALGISYMTGVPFFALFLLVNGPFYIFSVMRMGWKFTLYSLFAAVMVTLLTAIDQFLPNIIIPEWAGAILGGVLVGFGLSYLFWNGASLGGVNILVLYLQRKYGWDPGKTTFVADFVVVLTGLFSVGILKGIFSVFSVIILSSIISCFKTRIAYKNMATVALAQSTE